LAWFACCACYRASRSRAFSGDRRASTVWAWSGGVFGAIFIVLSIITVPKPGGAAYIAILVTGQMIAALAVDHFGWLGIPERHIDLPRLRSL